MSKATNSDGVLQGKNRNYHVQKRPAILSRHQKAIAEFPPKLDANDEQSLLKDAVRSALQDAFSALNVQWKAQNPESPSHFGYNVECTDFGSDCGDSNHYTLGLMAQNESDFTALVEALTNAGITCSAVEDTSKEYPRAGKNNLPPKLIRIATNDKWREMIDILNAEFIEKIRPEARISSKDIEADFQQLREARLKEKLDSAMERAKGSGRG